MFFFAHGPEMAGINVIVRNISNKSNNGMYIAT